VALPAPMQPGDQVVIAMDYEVVVPVTPGSNYAILAYMENVLALAHAYPMIPAYDDQIGWYTEVPPNYGDVTYSDSAYYLVRATLPSDQVVQASGFQFDSQENDGQTTTTWVAGPMRDFYLVSSNNYQAVETKVGDTVVRSYAPAKLKEESKLALQFAVDALEVFNKFYGVYPFTEMDVAGTPTLAGGVEYPGIVVIALTLYDPNHPFFEVATAHEVGHQWFYSVVGNDQVHHPWLDESLTQYNTMLYFKEVHGQKGYEEERSDQESRWEYIDYADIPLDLPVKDYNEAEYSGIIYGRGGLFFDDLRKKIGDEAFETFQKNYYDTYKWGIATTDGLKQVAEDACGCDLTSMFEEWVYPK
jgi:aminopeptidase N